MRIDDMRLEWVGRIVTAPNSAVSRAEQGWAELRTVPRWVCLTKRLLVLFVTISYRIAFVRHTFLICLMVINLGFCAVTHKVLRTNFRFPFRMSFAYGFALRCLFNRCITDSFSTVRFK